MRTVMIFIVCIWLIVVAAAIVVIINPPYLAGMFPTGLPILTCNVFGPSGCAGPLVTLP